MLVASNKLILSACVFLSIALITIAASGVRGTDQYQYIADVESIKQNLSQETNLYFPAKIIREKNNPTPNFFNHNGPYLHLVAMFKQFSTYKTWITLNFLCHLLVAFVIWIGSLRYSDKFVATCVTATYLLSPIAFWQTANVLQETYFSAITALFTLFWLFKQNPLARIGLPLIVFLGVFSHPLFLALSGAIAIYIGKELFTSRVKTDLVLLVCVLVSVFAANWFSPIFFPTQFQPDLKSIITSAIPGVSNMLWHYSVAQPELTFNLFAAKAIAAAKMHFFKPSFSFFYIFTNLAFTGILVLLWKKRHSKDFFMPVLLVFGLYVAIIVLQQNHARYQQIISPVTFIVLAATAALIKRKHVKLFTLALLAMSLTVDIMLCTRLRQQSVTQAEDVAQLAINTAALVDKTNIVAIDVSPHGPLAYALRPHNVLSIRTQHLKKSHIQEAIENFKPEYLILKSDSSQISDAVFQSRLFKRYQISEYPSDSLLGYLNSIAAN